ncbi:hypothetical protein Taro_005101 [Colocasia esculenta]|uniref:FHA domain-containing protein n=1 Tax=Colocasia esculenta TaxID=4460 RepID=A0A843TP44_COLES|nr:hypothetical protein [Colocasia esculenta]
MAYQIGKPGCEEEAKIPVFTVRKKGSVLKNIFLNGPPPELGLPGGSPGEHCPEEEKVLVGRHPDCHIVLDHPSVSRFHLEIRVRPSSQKLAVVDLSSVHGTWVSGNKIEPRIPVDLAEGDMVRLGASTRVYELHWVPVSSAFDWDKPLPALPEEQEQIHQVRFLLFFFFLLGGSLISSLPSPPALFTPFHRVLLSWILVRMHNFSDTFPMFQGENGIPAIDHFSFESWAYQIPSAPPMPQSFEYPLPSPVPSVVENQKPGIGALEEMVNSSIPAPEILSSSSPLEGQENRIPEAEASPKSPEPPKSERQVTSSLLSRRSKSISFLSVHTGRSREKQVTPSFHAGKQEENVVVFEQVRKEEALCKALFSTLDEECVDEETFLSDKENMTPGVSRSRMLQKNQMGLQKSLNIDAALCEKKDGFFSEKENCTPQEDGFSSDKENWTPQVSQANRQACKGAAESSIKPGRQREEEIYVSDKENMTPEVSHSHVLQKNLIGSQRSLNIDAVLDEKEDGFLSDKENCTPQVSQAIEQACKGAESSIKPGRQGEEEIYVSDKENMTPEVSHSHVLQKNQMGLQRSLNIDAALGEKEDGFSSDKENWTPQVSQANRQACKGAAESSIKPGRQGEEEIYVSDKENMTPEVSHSHVLQKNLIGSQRSLNIDAVLDEKEDGFFSDKENCTPQVSHAMRLVCKGAESSIKSGRQEEEHVSVKENKKTPVSGDQTSRDLSLTRRGISGEIIKRRVDRIPFQSLFESSRGKNSPLAGRIPFQSLGEKSVSKSSASAANLSPANSNLGKKSSPLLAEQGHHKVKVTKWYMVADTSCFLEEESRKSLQLLEGLRGTYLIIPRMVIRELDCLMRRESYFRKTSKASSALQWIEECMVNTSWWIHVQNSMESMPVAPTPPASPQVQDNSELHGPVSDPLLFSTCGSLAEILSPTAEDHILDCALLFKKIKSDGQLVLLTNEVSLKIKAMAEDNANEHCFFHYLLVNKKLKLHLGLLCESPKEFRQSLVNPFSQRFLWADSSPRGPTWSCSGQVSENGCYNHCPIMKKTSKAAEGAKGLKLILLHNSHYAQANLIKDR